MFSTKLLIVESEKEKKNSVAYLDAFVYHP